MLLIASPTAGVSASDESPRLRNGDVIAMSIIGVTELAHQSTVGVDGTVFLPLFGEVSTDGLSLTEFRKRLQSRVSEIAFRSKDSEGRIIPIDPGDIVVNLVAREPVYVNGDVSKPGAVTYRPKLTVRQAVALMGGYDVMRLRKTDPFMESSDLRRDYIRQWTDYADTTALIGRLEAELVEKDELAKMSIAEIPLDHGFIEGMVASHAKQLAMNNASFREDYKHLEASIQQVDEKLATLLAQGKVQGDDVEASKDDLKNLETLQERGLATSLRVTDARRAILLSSQMQLQTTVATMDAQARKVDLERSRKRLINDRKNELTRKLQEARIALATEVAALQATGDKLTYTGLLRSQLVRGGGKPDIAIHRRGAGDEIVALQGDEDTVLQPGDVVDIRLKLGD